MPNGVQPPQAGEARRQRGDKGHRSLVIACKWQHIRSPPAKWIHRWRIAVECSSEPCYGGFLSLAVAH
jgi:hypothetical protein